MLLKAMLSLCALSVSPFGTNAAEQILDYHSEIRLDQSGESTVSETITLVSEGKQIKRGIFRMLPLSFRDAAGRKLRAGFNMLSVTRDGEPEAFQTEETTDGVRIVAGNKDVLLREGEHTYVLTYKTDSGIQFAENFDELDWRVTGDGWAFPIARASARVTLPNGAEVKQTAATLGSRVSTPADVAIHRSGNIATFATLAPLTSSEGLRILLALPKGAISSQRREDKLFLAAHFSYFTLARRCYEAGVAFTDENVIAYSKELKKIAEASRIPKHERDRDWEDVQTEFEARASGVREGECTKLRIDLTRSLPDVFRSQDMVSPF